MASLLLKGSWFELDLSLRLCCFCVGHVVLFVWMRYVVAPARVGLSRILLAAPLLPLLLSMSFVFNIHKTEEFIAALYSVGTLSWQCTSKVWSFCLNRGQLVKSYESGSGRSFALSLLFPIIVAFDEQQVNSTKEHNHKRRRAYYDVQFKVIQFNGKAFYFEAGQILLRVTAKVRPNLSCQAGQVGVQMVLMMVMGKLGAMFDRSGSAFWRDVCMNWVVYGLMSFIEDGTSLFLLLTVNLKLASNFNCPWLAQSVTEMWSRRYNLVYGASLRDLVYDPIIEGRWIRAPVYFSRKSPSVRRRAVALIVTFIISGILHAFFMWFGFPIGFPYLYGFFFIANGFIVLFENIVKAGLKASGMYSSISARIPSWIFNVYTITVVFTLSHLFFWPEIIQSGFSARFGDAIMQLVHPLNYSI